MEARATTVDGELTRASAPLSLLCFRSRNSTGVSDWQAQRRLRRRRLRPLRPPHTYTHIHSFTSTPSLAFSGGKFVTVNFSADANVSCSVFQPPLNPLPPPPTPLLLYVKCAFTSLFVYNSFYRKEMFYFD